MTTTQLVGILNVTPDSFSDGGRYDTAEKAYKHAEQLLTDGADILDIGAESTRPDATPLIATQEWERLEPVLPDIVTLAHKQGKKVSLDTRHASTANHALTCGVDWINDVSGGRDKDLLHVVANAGCRYVAMHALTIPADKNITLPENADVVATLLDYFNVMIETYEKVGLSRDLLIIDPGLGFGKNASQSLALLWAAPEFQALDCPLYIGHSRKSCFGLMGDTSQREALTLLASHYLMHHNIDYLRVHNVRSHATLRKTFNITQT